MIDFFSCELKPKIPIDVHCQYYCQIQKKN